MTTDAMLIFFCILFPVIIIVATLENHIKTYIPRKKEALNCMGKDMTMSLIRKDEGAKLAFKGIMEFLGGFYRKATEYFEEALKLELSDENKAFCYDWLSHCYFRLDEHKEYTEVRARAARALPTNDNALVAYANCCAERGDFENAAHYYNQAIKYNPNNTFAYRSLGFMAETKGNYEKAIEYFETALKINPSDIDVMYDMAVCHSALGDYDAADEFMKKAVANDPDNRYESFKKKILDIRKINDGDLPRP